MNGIKPSITENISFKLLNIRDIALYLISKSYFTFIYGFKILSPKYLDWTSKIRAKNAYYNAINKVPAYRSFLENKTISKWEDIPYTDKENYIKKYSTELRCINGEIPFKDVMIDESSGSTGTPYNWVRNLSERRESQTFISFFSTFCFGKKPWITINAFSMGAWATGINMGVSLQRNGIVKNTGPDIEKIFSTLEFFGIEYDYMITGYPPFLKQIIDASKEKKFPLKNFKLCALVGGEGMSEGLRDYLMSVFDKVYSGYGATDLEIGIAGETPVSVAIRRLAKDDLKVKKSLFGNDSRLPMLFQYNPLMHHIEVENNELIFTITRNTVLSPRIKYNIHDEGGVIRYDQLKDKLLKLGHDLESLSKDNIKLPFLWVYGRTDYTISVMGANIYPEDLEACVYSDKALSKITRSFCQGLYEDKKSNVRPAFYLELNVNPTKALKTKFSKIIIENLIKINADFRAAWKECPETLKPMIYLHKIGEGPFCEDACKIKQKRILKKLK